MCASTGACVRAVFGHLAQTCVDLALVSRCVHVCVPG